MATTRNKKNGLSFGYVSVDSLPGAMGFLLSIGPAILWFDRTTGEKILTLLEEALSGLQREPIRPRNGN